MAEVNRFLGALQQLLPEFRQFHAQGQRAKEHRENLAFKYASLAQQRELAEEKAGKVKDNVPWDKVLTQIGIIARNLREDKEFGHGSNYQQALGAYISDFAGGIQDFERRLYENTGFSLRDLHDETKLDFFVSDAIAKHGSAASALSEMGLEDSYTKITDLVRDGVVDQQKSGSFPLSRIIPQAGKTFGGDSKISPNSPRSGAITSR